MKVEEPTILDLFLIWILLFISAIHIVGLSRLVLTWVNFALVFMIVSMLSFLIFLLLSTIHHWICLDVKIKFLDAQIEKLKEDARK